MGQKKKLLSQKQRLSISVFEVHLPTLTHTAVKNTLGVTANLFGHLSLMNSAFVERIFSDTVLYTLPIILTLCDKLNTEQLQILSYYIIFLTHFFRLMDTNCLDIFRVWDLSKLKEARRGRKWKHLSNTFSLPFPKDMGKCY